MKTERILREASGGTLPRMPDWVTSARVETLEDVAFLSGAALATLHLVVRSPLVPNTLLRDRLALHAATACMGFAGRSERAGDLRDTLHLLRPGDHPGPAGETYQSWRRAVERPVGIAALHRALPTIEPESIARWLDAATTDRARGPVAKAATVIETVLDDAPRAEVPALILADAALGQAVGWDHLLPLLAGGLKRGDLRKRGDELRLSLHRAVTASATDVVRMGADLARRAERLNAVAPKLRAKGAAEAVQIFLTRDAVAPSALPLAGRAARRLCDRLVDLGAVRELTGRETFRLYGI